MGMSKEQFAEQYRQFFPESTDEEIDKIYDEAKNLVDRGISEAKAKVGNKMGRSPFRNTDDEPRKEFSKDDLAAVDWQSLAEVVLSYNIQRYLNYWILKKTASKVLGRKVTFKEVYYASMALRAITRIVMEVGVSRVSIESDAVAKIKKALEPITNR